MQMKETEMQMATVEEMMSTSSMKEKETMTTMSIKKVKTQMRKIEPQMKVIEQIIITLI